MAETAPPVPSHPSHSEDPHGVHDLAARREKALAMGGPAKVAKVHSAGKLTIRERIDRLVEPGSFREVGLLAHSDLPDARDKTPADGKVCGFGTIDGRTVYVSGEDATVLAGSGGRVGVKKDHDAMAYAAAKGFPLVSLGDGGGARIPDIMGATGMMSMVYPSRACRAIGGCRSSRPSSASATAAPRGRRRSRTSSSR